MEPREVAVATVANIALPGLRVLASLPREPTVVLPRMRGRSQLRVTERPPLGVRYFSLRFSVHGFSDIRPYLSSFFRVFPVSACLSTNIRYFARGSIDGVSHRLT